MDESRYAQTTTCIAIHPIDESPIFGERLTTVEIMDEGGGLFICIKQGESEVRLDHDELVLIADAAKMLIEGAKIGKSMEKEK